MNADELDRNMHIALLHIRAIRLLFRCLPGTKLSKVFFWSWVGKISRILHSITCTNQITLLLDGYVVGGLLRCWMYIFMFSIVKPYKLTTVNVTLIQTQVTGGCIGVAGIISTTFFRIKA